MIHLLADENFNGRILRGIKSRNPNANILRVQDTEMYQADDMSLLAWAAKEQRVVVSHDVNTMTKYAYQRIDEGLPMAGLILIQDNEAVGTAIEELLIAIEVYEAEDLVNLVTYLP